jgi:hypothetical protein
MLSGELAVLQAPMFDCQRWLGLFEQRLAKDKWNVCRFRCSAEMGRLAGRA